VRCVALLFTFVDARYRCSLPVLLRCPLLRRAAACSVRCFAVLIYVVALRCSVPDGVVVAFDLFRFTVFYLPALMLFGC